MCNLPCDDHGTTIIVLLLRILPGEESSNVHKCGFGEASCPASANASRCDGSELGYCACGYVGPLCSVCAPEYFLTKTSTGNACSDCNESRGWGPTIIIASVLVTCAALIAAACIKTGLKTKLLCFYKTGKTKGLVLVQVCQVVSQFSSISQATGDGKTYLEPASTFVQLLALSNFDFLTFGAGCATPRATFYTTLAIKTTILPLGPCVLLWIWAAVSDQRGVRTTAAKLSLLWIELVLTGGECFKVTWHIR